MVEIDKDNGVKIPEDLGLKIGTKDEALWTDVKETTEAQIEGLEKSLKVNRAILEMAKKKIKEEEEKRGGK